MGQPQQVDVELVLPLGAKTIRADARDVSAPDAEQFDSGATLATAQQTLTLTDAQLFEPATITLDLAAPMPAITGFSPATVRYGDTLTITGSGFGTDPNALTVRFGYYHDTVPSTISPTRITVVVPQIDVGPYDVGIYPTGGMSVHAVGELRVIREYTLAGYEWEYIPGIVNSTFGYGQTFVHENATPEESNYYKVTAVMNAPQTVVHGTPNRQTAISVSVKFEPKSATWATQNATLSVRSWLAQYSYPKTDHIVVNTAPAGGAYTMALALADTDRAQGDDIVNQTFTAVPRFADGLTAHTRGTPWGGYCEVEQFDWTVFVGDYYGSVVHVRGRAIYTAH
jgi:hypothetical protein